MKMTVIPKEVKFMHLRAHGAAEMQEINGEEVYVEPVLATGGCTIAYKVEPMDGDKQAVRYAFAKCHEFDNFNKRTGRIKAAGRLQSAHAAYLETIDKATTREQLHEMLREAYYEDVEIESGGNVDVREFIY